MTIVEVMQKFDTQEKCLAILEQARWGDGRVCPYCQSEKTSHNNEQGRSHRYQCQECNNSFSVTVGTIFHKAKKLPQWFMILSLMVNAKKSLSSCQVSRDIGMQQPSCWRIMNKIRLAMTTEESTLLKGIVEMDETYIGGKPRGNTGNNKRGRGTKKLPVVGACERGGQVRAQVVPKSQKLNFNTLKAIYDKNVDILKSMLMTDEYAGYAPMAAAGVPHLVINHSEQFVNGNIHTNTIESFWSLLKRAWYGSHHHYSKERTHLYVAETCYKYNNRKCGNLFMKTIARMVG